MRQRLTLEPSGSAAPEVSRWLAALTDCRDRTLRALEGLADEDLDREGGLGSPNTIGTLLYHVAAIEADWLVAEIQEGAKPFPKILFPFDVREDGGRLTPVTGITVSGHMERLVSMRALLLGELGDMGADEFHRARELADYDVAPDWVLHHLMQHEAEHRDQMSEIRERPS
jgi:uncharacterized damage-inducible protein DinB